MALSETQIEIIGIVAGCLTTASFFPQAMKIYKTRHTKDLSLAMFSMLNVGIILWVAYGILKMSPAVILANGLTLILAMYILVMKIRLR